MADPMIPLLSFQQKLDSGASVDSSLIIEDYLTMYDEPGEGRRRYSYAKIIGKEIQTLAIFGLENSVDGIVCYNVGYAVKENHRGRGLAVEAINKGIEDLKKKFSLQGIKNFYLEAVVGVNNKHSIQVAEKIFLKPGVLILESESNTPSLLFRKLISVS